MNCANCGHIAHPDSTCNTKGCDCAEFKEAEASNASTELGAIGSHSTSVSEGSWDAGPNEKNCPNTEAALRAAHAWVNPDGDPTAKTSYKFIHHEVSAEGTVGAANLTACSTGIGVLNGGRGGTTIPRSDYDGVYNHLARHLRDGDREPPEKNYQSKPTRFAKQKTADPPPVVDTATGTPYKRWRMPVAVLEGVRTGDGRKIAPEAITWRDLPQSLMALTKTTQGHDEAELVGRIDSARRVDASKMTDSRTGEPYGKGTYAVELSGVFTNEDQAARVAKLIQDRFIRGVSVDLSDVEYEVEYIDKDSGEPAEIEDPLESLFFDGDMLELVTQGRIMGVTITPFPAFEGAYIELLDDEGNVGPATQPSRPTAIEQKESLRIHSNFVSRACGPCTNGRPLVAGAGPQYPPKSWFEDPKLDGPTPLTILDEGRIVGHLATWGVCHTGIENDCVIAPHSQSDYALFRLGVTKTAEGDMVPTGTITMDTGHAGLRVSRLAALRHYDHTGTAVADISAGEDAHGIWIAGALRPDLSESQVRALRAATLSGDWREWGGHLEMIAALAVNRPGFPIVRSRIASGMPQALVAAGSATLSQPETVSIELNELLAYLPELRIMKQGRVSAARAKMAQARRDTVRARMQALGS